MKAESWDRERHREGRGQEQSATALLRQQYSDAGARTLCMRVWKPRSSAVVRMRCCRRKSGRLIDALAATRWQVT